MPRDANFVIYAFMTRSYIINSNVEKKKQTVSGFVSAAFMKIIRYLQEASQEVL